MGIKENAEKIVSKLTLEEKMKLQTGIDNWQVEIPSNSQPTLWLSDGPCGLRKENDANVALGNSPSAKAVCFPAPVTLAATFDRKLALSEGDAIAKQCKAKNVGVLLAPGVNIKRSVLCGRNFEYFSEDPFLAAEIAVPYIQGVQNQNVGVSLKHFAVNSCEHARMVNDSIVDEKALREIYLRAFQKAVTIAKPWTVMAAYNKVNGVYCAENERLLTSILRNEWGFDGVVVTDWGANNYRPDGIKAGCDLEMPRGTVATVSYALESGELNEKDLNACCQRIVEMVLKSKQRVKESCDFDAQHALARQIAADGMVLLKNTCNILPFSQKEKILVIGALAKNPHYQGQGSSCVNSYDADSFYSALKANKFSFDYADGYEIDSRDSNKKLLNHAVELATQANKVVVFLGYTDLYESEGFDKLSIDLPQNQIELLNAVTAANGNVVVVLQCGSPCDTTWLNSVKGALCCYMGGEAGGAAVADVLYGNVCPNGRLPESWPFSHKDEACYGNFATDVKKTLYKESIFVGYRYYLTANKEVRFPFGYGLSYANVEYQSANLSIDSIEKGESVFVNVELKNASNLSCKEVVQIYVSKRCGKDIKPLRELKGFEKVELKGNEKKSVEIELDKSAFETYDVTNKSWIVDGGEYLVEVCKNAEQVLFSLPLMISGKVLSKDRQNEIPDYYKADVQKASNEEFERLLGRAVEDYSYKKGEPFTLNSTVGELTRCFWGRLLHFAVMKTATKGLKDTINEQRQKEVIDNSPLRSAIPFFGFSYETVMALLDVLNKKKGGLARLIREFGKGQKEKKKSIKEKKK